MLRSSLRKHLQCVAFVLICVLSSAGQNFLFNRYDFPLGSQPGGIATADFNRDGIPDVAVTDSSAQTVTILLGQIDGTFKQGMTYSTGYEPGSVAVGDFNHDGKVDIVVANWVGSSVSVYLGKGNGKFKPPITTNVPYYASELAVADFNQDGIPDLAVTSNSTNSVYVLVGKGDGSFETPVTYTTPSFTIGIVAQDFNRDGHVDLAMADTYGNDIYVMLGNGDGTFQAGMSFAAGEVPVELAAGDFNGDGILDLVVADGPDCGCAYMSVLLGNGDGTFQAPNTSSIAAAGFVLVGDFNGDHKLDVALSSGSLNIALGKGDGTFAPTLTYGSDGSAENLVSGDFNGDGIPDVVMTNFNGNENTAVSILLGNGDGSFGATSSYTTGQTSVGIVTADFNGDGKPDLATVNIGSSNVSVLLGTGKGKLANAVNYNVSSGQYGPLVSADFNGDKHPDLASVNYSAGTVSILLNQGNGTFGVYRDYAAGSNPTTLVAGDFNRDGANDIVVGNSNGLYFLKGNGKGGFASPVVAAAGSSPYAMTVADFNGDGNLDVASVSGSYESSSVTVYMGKGDGTFAAAVNYGVGIGPVSVVAADFNHDGKIDLAVLAGARVYMLLGNGDGTFQSSSVYQAPNSPLQLLAADLTGDGNLDVAVLGSNLSDFLAIMPGDGEGHLGGARLFNPGAAPTGIVAVDLDGNGSIDLAIANSVYGTGNVTVMLNEATAALFPANLKFPRTAVGSKSETMDVTFTNSGTVAVQISAITVTGANAGDFAETNTCGVSLSVGQNCTVSVYFEPAHKGQRSAILLFSDDALSGSQSVLLSGKAH